MFDFVSKYKISFYDESFKSNYFDLSSSPKSRELKVGHVGKARPMTQSGLTSVWLPSFGTQLVSLTLLNIISGYIPVHCGWVTHW